MRRERDIKWDSRLFIGSESIKRQHPAYLPRNSRPRKRDIRDIMAYLLPSPPGSDYYPDDILGLDGKDFDDDDEGGFDDGSGPVPYLPSPYIPFSLLPHTPPPSPPPLDSSTRKGKLRGISSYFMPISQCSNYDLDFVMSDISDSDGSEFEDEGDPGSYLPPTPPPSPPPFGPRCTTNQRQQLPPSTTTTSTFPQPRKFSFVWVNMADETHGCNSYDSYHLIAALNRLGLGGRSHTNLSNPPSNSSPTSKPPALSSHLPSFLSQIHHLFALDKSQRDIWAIQMLYIPSDETRDQRTVFLVSEATWEGIKGLIARDEEAGFEWRVHTCRKNARGMDVDVGWERKKRGIQFVAATTGRVGCVELLEGLGDGEGKRRRIG